MWSTHTNCGLFTIALWMAIWEPLCWGVCVCMLLDQSLCEKQHQWNQWSCELLQGFAVPLSERRGKNLKISKVNALSNQRSETQGNSSYLKLFMFNKEKRPQILCISNAVMLVFLKKPYILGRAWMACSLMLSWNVTLGFRKVQMKKHPSGVFCSSATVSGPRVGDHAIW